MSCNTDGARNDYEKERKRKEKEEECRKKLKN